MQTNATITIYNQVYDATTKTHIWRGTRINKATWYNDLATAISSNAVSSKDMFKVRIPDDAQASNDRNYVDAWSYKLAEHPEYYWTLQKDDIVALGEFTTVINGMADLTKAGIKAFRITSYSDNRRGGLPHWRIGGE